MSVFYRKRQSMLAKADTEWLVEFDALVIRKPDEAERRVPWQDVVSVRVSHLPARRKSWRHIFVLSLKGGQKIVADNIHFSWAKGFENASDTYVPFVKAALDRIRKHNPAARAYMGSSQMSYVLNLLFLLAMFVLLIVVMIVLPMPFDYLSWSSVARIAIVILFIPTVIDWAKKARPRETSLDKISDDWFPKVTETRIS